MRERIKDIIILIVNDMVLLFCIFTLLLSFFIMNYAVENNFSIESINELFASIFEWFKELWK